MNRGTRICSPRERMADQWFSFKTALNPPTAHQWVTGFLQKAPLPMVAAARPRDREARIQLGLPQIDWKARR